MLLRFTTFEFVFQPKMLMRLFTICIALICCHYIVCRAEKAFSIDNHPQLLENLKTVVSEACLDEVLKALPLIEEYMVLMRTFPNHVGITTSNNFTDLTSTNRRKISSCAGECPVTPFSSKQTKTIASHLRENIEQDKRNGK